MIQSTSGRSHLGAILLLTLGCATITGPKSGPTKVASTQKAIAGVAVTRTYDVRDILVEEPDPNAADFPAVIPDPLSGTPRTHEELVRDLIISITSTVDPFSWRENTGQIGSIRESDDQLVVTQTPANHAAILEKLMRMRLSHGMAATPITGTAATVSTRFITIDSPVQFLGSPGQKWIESADGSFGLWPQFLDDQAVDRLIRATQEQPQSTRITAPRLTLFDGQRANVMVATTRAHVAGFKPSANGFDPQIETVWSGIRLDCWLQISPDLKLATLNFHPNLQTLLGLTAAPWPDAPPGQNDMTIQIPQLSITTMDATITMPDRHSAVYLLHPQGPQNAQPATQPFKPPTQSTLLIVRPEITAQQESNPNPNSN